SQTIDSASALNVYVPNWNVTNNARIDNPTICQNLLDHVTPPGYRAALRNQHDVAFLDAVNINSAQHICMISELHLRYEHEIMSRENFKKKFTDSVAIDQQRDAKIADMKARLEKSKAEAAEVIEHRKRVSDLEAAVAIKVDSKRRAFWSLNEDILKITILMTNAPYPSRKIRRIRACTHQRPQRNKDQYAVSRENQYAVFKIWNQYNILEDIKRGPYSKKSPIRRIQLLICRIQPTSRP
ncbi:hypothetical protein Tco_1489402, partial [Tanacetum coccineum]